MTYVLKTKDGERTAESPEDAADLLMQGRDLWELANICAEWEIAMEAENKDGCVADMLAQSFLGHGRNLRDELALMIECLAGYGPGFNGADFEVVWCDEEAGE